MESLYQGGAMYEEPPDFQRLSGVIASNIKKMSQNVLSMSKMVNQLQTPQDSQELRNQLRQIQNYTQKMAKDTSTQIMQLMKLPTDQVAQKLSRDRLSDEYMATLNSFQSTQRLAAQKTKEDVKKVKSQNVIALEPYNSGSRSKTAGREIELGDSRRQEQLTAQSERSLHELEERERDVRQLEEDILAVNDIFKDLGQLVHGQGVLVDSIESHVESTAQNVESGVQQLREASSIKNRIRKRKAYIGIILLIVISIILIIWLAR